MNKALKTSFLRLLFGIISCFIVVNFSSSVVVADMTGKFEELNFEQYDENKPVALNDNEIFFSGGQYDGKKKICSSAKIYKVKERSFIDTNKTMNFPRRNIGIVKYNDNQILIIGGYCNNLDNANNCNKIIEIYNIKENNFTRISDTIFPHNSGITALTLDNGLVLILSNSQIELFDPKNNKISQTDNGKDINNFKNKYYYSHTAHPYISSNIIPLDNNKFLIYGFLPVSSGKYKDAFAMEIFDLETEKSEIINIDRDLLSYNNIGGLVKISDGSILFIGAGKDKKDVIKFEPRNKTFLKINRLSKALAGQAILLDNDNILIAKGGITNPPDFLTTISLDYAIYDYKKNKIYNRKTTNKTYYQPHITKLKNYIYISGYREQKPILYSY